MTEIHSGKFFEDCKKLAEKVKANGKKYNNIYAVLRGGLPVAQELSKYLGISVIPGYGENTLVVDDLVDSGKTIQQFEKYNCDVAVLYVKPYTPNKEKLIYVEEINDWIEFWYEDSQEDAESIITRTLEEIGENPIREGLLDTPKRVVKMWGEIFSGYREDSEGLFKAVFTSTSDEMVIIKDIPFYSYCEHHMVPFFGKANIGYIPNGKVLGLSKFARLVDIYAKRLQIQEQLTTQVADDIMKYLSPKGVMVVINAEHLCMSMRGIKKPGSNTTTSATRGVFRKDQNTRQEFLNLIK